MFTEATLRRELKLLQEQSREAMTEPDRSRADWLYGAIVALSWAIDDPENQTMKPSKAFTPALV